MTQPAAAHRAPHVAAAQAVPTGPVAAVARWALPLIALLVAGPAISWPLRHLRAPDGGADTTLLLSNAPVRGVLLLALAAGVALVLGRLAASVLNRAIALGIAGYCLLWAAWMTGSMDEIYRVWPADVGTVARLAVEGALVGLAALGVAAVILGRAPAGERPPLAALLGPALSAAAVAGAVAWAIARDDHRGQCLFAAFLGGIAAGCVARIAQVQLHQEKHDAPARTAMLLGVAGCALAAVGAPLVGLFMPGAEKLAIEATAHRLPGLLRLQPMDWAAGALLGVPVGLNWAAGMLPHPDARR